MEFNCTWPQQLVCTSSCLHFALMDSPPGWLLSRKTAQEMLVKNASTIQEAHRKVKDLDQQMARSMESMQVRPPVSPESKCILR